MQDENNVVNLTSHVLFHVTFCTCSDLNINPMFELRVAILIIMLPIKSF